MTQILCSESKHILSVRLKISVIKFIQHKVLNTFKSYI